MENLFRILKITIFSDLKRKSFLEGVILQFQYEFFSVLSSKNLLNFETPDPRAKVSSLTKEEETAE